MRPLMKAFVIVLLGYCLIACTTTTKPLVHPDSNEQTAYLDDTFIDLGYSNAYFFYLVSVEGTPVDNAVAMTRNASYGNGFRLSPRGKSRRIPIKPLKVRLVAERYYAAPISSISDSRKSPKIEGELDFTPKPDEHYAIKGRLKDGRAEMWIENSMGLPISGILANESGDDAATAELIPLSTSEAEKSTERLFAEISGGESADLVVKKLGQPDKVEALGNKFFTSKERKFAYEYGHLGVIEVLAIGKMTPFVYHTEPFIRSSISPQKLTQDLAVTGRKLQVLSQSLYKTPNLNNEAQDILADKIWSLRNSEDDYDIDAASWLCKTLAKNGNGRYKRFLRKVSQSVSSKKLRKYATKSYEQLRDDEASSYSPSSQPISEWAQ